MTTSINNNLRVFQVLTSTGRQVFCNITELNKVIANMGTNPGYFRINHFWNTKAQKLTKKHLAELFESAGIKQEFQY